MSWKEIKYEKPNYHRHSIVVFIANPVSGAATHETLQGKPSIITIFFILGCLDEYRGRMIVEKNKDVVESFYSSEAQASQVFEKYLKRLVSEEEINTRIRKEITKGGHILFHSPELYKRINSMYPHNFNKSKSRVRTSNSLEGQYVRMVEAFVSMSLFNRQDKSAKLSYLAGAYARYGQRLNDNEYSFNTANAGHKIALISELLKEFGCADMTHKTSDPRAHPMSHTLLFTASPEIKNLLNNVSKEINGRDQVGHSVIK